MSSDPIDVLNMYNFFLEAKASKAFSDHATAQSDEQFAVLYGLFFSEDAAYKAHIALISAYSALRVNSQFIRSCERAAANGVLHSKRARKLSRCAGDASLAMLHG